MTNTARRILIVGGGIAGFAQARALRRRGLDSTVVERSPAWADVGTGHYLPGNAHRALAALGLHERIAPARVLRAAGPARHDGGGALGRTSRFRRLRSGAGQAPALDSREAPCTTSDRAVVIEHQLLLDHRGRTLVDVH